jgi:hypothetical protein
MWRLWRLAMTAALWASFLFSSLVVAADPPAISPFGRPNADKSENAPPRDDAIQGYVKLSNGQVRPGWLYVTRDKRLKIYDEKVQRQREIPLSAIAQIDCTVKKEWIEKEWKFKETTVDTKIYTGRQYPSREYLHSITLHNGKKIAGPMSAIVYLQTSSDEDPEQFLLNKRNKGEMGKTLKSLVYVQQIRLGKEAYEEGVKKFKAKSAAKKIEKSGDEKTGEKSGEKSGDDEKSGDKEKETEKQQPADSEK